MIRINLLAGERKAAKKSRRRRSAAASSSRSAAASFCVAGGRAHRLALLVDLTQRVDAARRRHRGRAAGNARGCTRVIAAGAAVRAAQGAAPAARHAHRAAAQGPDRAGPHARPDQPGAAADAVAHRIEADDDRRRSRDRRPRTTLTGAVRLRRQSRSVGLFQALGRDREHRPRPTRGRGELDQVPDQGQFNSPARGARGSSRDGAAEAHVTRPSSVNAASSCRPRYG